MICRGEGGDDQSTGFEGMEAMAQAIELGKGPYFFNPSLFSVLWDKK